MLGDSQNRQRLKTEEYFAGSLYKWLLRRRFFREVLPAAIMVAERIAAARPLCTLAVQASDEAEVASCKS